MEISYAPQIPHEIQCRSCSLIKGKSCYSLGIIHIFLTTVELLSYLNSIQIAIFIQWNTTMKQQIPIVYTVYAAFFIQEFHMIAQYMAVAEGSPQSSITFCSSSDNTYGCLKSIVGKYVSFRSYSCPSMHTVPFPRSILSAVGGHPYCILSGA